MRTIQASGKQTVDSHKRRAASSEYLLQEAFDNSFQANIISRLKDGRIIWANKAACKLLGYSKKELLTKDKTDIFGTSEGDYKKMLRQRKEDGYAKVDLSVIRKSGKILFCEITSVLFKDENGLSNSIMSIVDLKERMLKQKKIDVESQKVVASNIVIAQSKSDTRQAESSDWIRSIVKVSYDVIWDWDITTNLISFGHNYEKVFGYKLPKNKISFKEWLDYFRPEERAIVEKKVSKIFESDKKTWQASYQFICPDGTAGEVISQAGVIRDNEGKATRMIGVIHDISRLRKLEGMRETEDRNKKKQIIDAIIEAKEMERSDLGKELHDNINQLLGASMLHLDMARKDLNNGEVYLIHSSEYILTAIEEIRKLTKGLITDTIRDFGLCEAIRHISRDTMETYPVKIHCVLDDSLEETMSGKFKLNIFRILQEQFNNILKHAKASELNVSISQTNAGFVLSIADDGVGFDTAKKTNGIGISNIVSRAEIYKGNASFISKPGKGCTLVVIFPVIDVD